MKFRRRKALEQEYFCIYCEIHPDRWRPYRDGSRSPVLNELSVIGSDIENFYCPNCECFDRERHLRLYFDTLDLWSEIRGKRVLHIAPETHFGELVRLGSDTYIRGDISPTDSSVVRVDLTSTQFPNCHFDAVIANHVLEHILDDAAAISEVSRILKPGCFAILQIPYSPLLYESLESPSLQDEQLKTFLFGQEDHVRLYGLDFLDRVKRAGLDIRLISHSEVLPNVSAKRFGVNEREPLFFVSKPK